MHPTKIIFSFLIVTLSLTKGAQAQDGTIKVQRNPVRLDSNIIWCGGIWNRSWFVFELSAYQPLDNPAQVFYLPKNFSPKKFMLEDGYGAHIVLSNRYTRVPYGAVGQSSLNFLTGFDRFKGKEGDSLFSDGNTHHYNYMFNMIPIHLLFNISVMNRLTSRKFFMSLTVEGGKNLLFTKFSGTPSDFNETKWVNAFAGGFSFKLLYLRKHTLGLSLKTARIDKQWFREIDLSFPIFYGRYKRPTAVRTNDPRPF